ncbi:MAG: DUF4393 domain-containing protein [Paludibacter sp.]|nr:DUF4393 domain-containing protein [Paludibacter sp.]
MTPEDNNQTNVKATIEAVTGLAKEIPIYQDAVQPAAKEIGKSLETITKTVNIALAPIKALVWGYERIEDYLTNRVSEKLRDIPKENITTPPLHIAGPAVEALRFTGHNENLRELYASLLAMAMNKETSAKAHPSFVEVIKNLSTEEAIILQSFVSQTEYPKIDINEKIRGKEGAISRFRNFTLFHKIHSKIKVNSTPTYLDNLKRLGVIEILLDQYFVDTKLYEPLENDDSLSELKDQIKITGNTVEIKKGLIRLTSFGKVFVQNVVAMK